MRKNLKKTLIKKNHLFEDLKMLQELDNLLNSNFIMIYIIHKILVLLKNHLNHLKDAFSRSIINFLKK